MHMRVDKTRHHRAIADVDHPQAGRQLHLRHLSYSGDACLVNDHDSIAHHWPSCANK